MEITNDIIYKDEYLGAYYRTSRLNAQHLRKYLLQDLNERGINPLDYNIKGAGDKENIDIEIYEYQPFFLLKRIDGEYSLLDGFRRLIYYDAPNHIINVRIYNEEDLSSEQIMKLMIYLNHFKFFVGGTYYDRGFALALKTIFGLNIPKYHELMDSYLTLNNVHRKYWSERVNDKEENESVKERLLNPKFISDMNFLDKLSDTDYRLNVEFGALLYKFRNENPDFNFDPDIFIKKLDENKLIQDLQIKYKKLRYNGHGERDKEAVNQLMKFYENIFNEMLGKEIEKTYTEIFDDCKELVKKLKKDKSLTKLTGLRDIYDAELIMLNRLRNKETLKFTCVVFPKETDPDNYGWRNDEITKDHIIKPGILDDEIYLMKVEDKKPFGGKEMVFGFTKGKVEFNINHNYGGFHNYGKKYTILRPKGLGGMSYDIELFVDIPNDDVKKQRIKRLGR